MTKFVLILLLYQGFPVMVTTDRLSQPLTAETCKSEAEYYMQSSNKIVEGYFCSDTEKEITK
jgi:hypothetical protein